MAITVKRNLIEGAFAEFAIGITSANVAVQDGYNEIAVVKGVTGRGTIGPPGGEVSGSGTPINKFWEAMNATDSTTGAFVPQIGTEDGAGFILSRATAAGVSTDTVRINLFWHRVGFIRSEIRNFLTSKQTNLGFDTLQSAPVIDPETGLLKPITPPAALKTVSHTYNDEAQHPGRPTTDTQSGLVTVLSPEALWTAWRVERFDPENKARTFIGHVNDAGWDVFTESVAGQWLCEDISSTFNPQTGLFDVGYQFHFRAETWISSVFFRDTNGRPPHDIVAGTGTKSYWVYTKKQFSELKLLSLES